MECLYFLDEDDSYRGVLYGIELLDIPTKSDDMKGGRCCVRVRAIQSV